MANNSATHTNERRVTVVFSPEDFARFEAYCKDNGMKKSSLIVQLVTRHLDEVGFRYQQGLFKDR